MLYDTVPGGTGYLKQMMGDPNNLLKVLRLARDAIAECECNADPMKDGCYRCVYAYRRSYGHGRHFPHSGACRAERDA